MRCAAFVAVDAVTLVIQNPNKAQAKIHNPADS